MPPSFATPARCRRARFADEEQARSAAERQGPTWQATRCNECSAWHLVSRERRQLRLSPPLARAVIAGRKTTHRVPAGRSACRYIVGHEYPVTYEQPLTDELGDLVRNHQGAARATYGTAATVTITDITREQLIAIDDDSAATEGFNGFGAFLDYWLETHGELTNRRMESDVYVLHLQVEQIDSPHLLADPQAQASYTTGEHRALRTPEIGNLGPIPEPEAIDPAIVESLPSSLSAKQRHARDRAEAERRYDGMTLGQRIDRALAEAQRNRIDATPAERLANRVVTDLERRIDRAA